VPLPAQVRDNLKTKLMHFATSHDFPHLYQTYEWWEDRWRSGFPRMLGLEVSLSHTAKSNRVYREQLEAVARWGRKRGTVECDDEVSLPLYVDGKLDEALVERPQLPLVELDRQTKRFGPTYLSKVLLFACPEEYGAIDTRLVTVFGEDGEGWIDLHARDWGSGDRIPRQASWPSEFGTWTQVLRWFAHHLNETGVECPHPDAYVECGLRSGGRWYCADVETALFSYATERLGSLGRRP
jgi:hypothetical protein